MADRNKTRRENYKRLRDAGFSPEEADRLKGAKTEYINRVIKTKQLPPVNPVKRAASYKKTKADIDKREMRAFQAGFRKWLKKAEHNIIGIPPRVKKGRIKYLPVNRLTFDYQSNYTYVMAFQVKNPDGSREWKYVTLVSATPRTRRELNMELRQEILADYDNMTKYESTPLVSTITLVQAFAR